MCKDRGPPAPWATRADARREVHMSTAFVTGGSGFVGRNLIGALRARGDTVRALARSDAAAEAVRASGAEPVRGDLDDEAALRAGLQGCDVVYHAAAHVKEWGSYADFERVNVGGTERVIAAARACAVRRLVHVSTEAVLVGSGPLVDVDETRPRPARPIGLYPRSKAEAEARVLAAEGIEVVVIRPRLIWGHGDSSLLPQIVDAVREGRFAWIGGGRYPTSTCHVRNVCAGAIAAAERGRPRGIYFLTDGAPVETRAFLSALLRTQGVEPPSRTVPHAVAAAVAFVAEGLWRAFGVKSPPPVTRTAVKLLGEPVTVNDALARREIGYREAITREQGLAEMTPSS
jgi:nucleoside-diphosphate-sugar epimerase